MFAVALYSGTENRRGEWQSRGTPLRLRVFASGGDARRDRTFPVNREGELVNGRAIPRMYQHESCWKNFSDGVGSREGGSNAEEEVLRGLCPGI
jgi:hypothetical protein